MEKKRINVKVDHNDHAFFTDNVTVSHNQSKFVIDFSQTIPSFDNVGGNMQQSFIIKHKAVMLDPQFAKIFVDLLQKNIKKYEKKFGKIKLPKKRRAKKKEVMDVAEKSTRYIG
ncbi:MAG: DUF3467 domain-containing protein [Candidatus Thorarchaeota archaeon]